MDDDARISPRDKAELAALWEEYAESIIRYACVLTRGDLQQAEDLRQETFVAAAVAWAATVRSLAPEKQKKWLRTTLQNKAYASYSREEKHHAQLGQLIPLQQPSTGTSDEEQAAAIEDMAVIIQGLPSQQYRIALMKWSGMKAREVAAELGIAEGTVHATLSAVREKLAGPLARYRKAGQGGKGEAS